MADTEVKDVKEEVAHEEEGNDEVRLGSVWVVNCALGGSLIAFGRLSLKIVGLDILA